MSVTRTFDLLNQYVEKFADKTDALTPKVNGEWKGFSSKDYVDYAYHVSYGLMELGVQAGDKIALVSNNRPEWNMTDHGVSMTGAILTPFFATLDTEGYEMQLNHSDARLVIVSDAALYKKIAPLVEKIPHLEDIYVIEEVQGAKSWYDLVALGKENAEKHREELEKRKAAVQPTDCVTIIYTSGTTGNSKGVMLSHENLVTNFRNASNVFGTTPDERYLCILPLCHVGERMANYSAQYAGASVYYAQNMGTIADDLKEVKPHSFGTVPRILEKIYEKVVQRGEALTGMKKKMFFWALKLGHDFDVTGKSWWFRWQHKQASKLIFSKWREAIGGNIKLVGVGGAALQPRLERVFWAAGVPLLNMYGLTETSPVCTINSFDKIKLGTVGAVLDGVEVRLAEDGEILVKGPNVMMGYYKDEAATAEAIKDGWFHSGDVGVIDSDGFLKITDRKKALFKLSNGKYVAPQAIENLFKESVFVDQLMVIGEGQKFTSALISPSYEALREWGREKGLTFTSLPEAIALPEVQKLFNEIAKDMNQSLGKDEQVKRFRLVPDEWTIESGEMTPKLSLKRRVVAEKYATLMDEIFGQATV